MEITMSEGLCELFEELARQNKWQISGSGYGCGSTEYDVDGTDLTTIHNALCAKIREDVCAVGEDDADDNQ
jgi:hypothetical protein